MTYEAMLTARAHESGAAVPTALLRHRALARSPLCIVAWQLGAEPYAVGAIALGRQRSGYELFVPGYPINRDLLFASLTNFATVFCRAFEAPSTGTCETEEHFGSPLQVPTVLPQILVANPETINLLGRLGRRLAYLPTTGEQPVAPVLVRMGRHLMWLADHASMPGQQVILSVTDLLASHYATGMSAYESTSLASLDAWIAPPNGMHGFEAAEDAERHAVGPVPDPRDGEKIHDAMGKFNAARAGNTNRDVVHRLSRPLRILYDGMVRDTWNLIWKAIDRERAAHREAPSVERRAHADRVAYASHMAWMAGPAEGRRKTRMTPRAAAMRLNEYERAQRLLEAEEAIDDPLRMAPVLLAGDAIAGDVIDCDPNRKERIKSRNCKRPSVTLRSQEPCALPVGTELWWTRAARAREWVIERVVPTGEGAEVTLVLQTNHQLEAGLPRIGRRACFSKLNTRDSYEVHLPFEVPWTHRVAETPAATALESEAA